MSSNKSFSYRWGSALSVLYVAFRISTANLSPITDCDEVYNYWEPLHFILYGTGMQTWEYAPQYALRTYAYLLPMAVVAKCFQSLLYLLPSSLIRQLHTILLLPEPAIGIEPKPLLFALLRSFLAFVSCYSELSFLNAIHDVISPTISHFTALCSFTAAGNFHASQAYLPSSSVMILWRLSAANQIKNNDKLAILWGLVAVLATGWPFCAVLFISTGFWALWRAGLGKMCSKSTTSEDVNGSHRQCITSVAKVLTRTLCHAVFIQLAVMLVDYYYYGVVVSPTWNIFVYNAQSGGDELYGVEPLSYYIKNMLLNFNLVAVLGIVSLPILILKGFFNMNLHRKRDWNDENCNVDNLRMVVLSPMYMWIAIVFLRPHKEERFLFPIYPMLCSGAAVAIDEVITLLLGHFKAEKIGSSQLFNARLFLGLAVLFPCSLASVSRSFALYHYYSAPLSVYSKLYSSVVHPLSSSNNDAMTMVCTAGEWYRFPSSFFLPPKSQLGFLKSSFTGQLPQPFTKFGSRLDSLSVQHGTFNNDNSEELDRYVDFEHCSYMIELVPSKNKSYSSDDPEGLHYMKSDSSSNLWTRLASYPYLDSKSTSTLRRIFYVPFVNDRLVVYNEYNAYEKSYVI